MNMNDEITNIPKIRFKGYTEDWEQRKLGEVIRFLNGKAYKQQELLDSGKYRVLRVGNFNTNDRWYYSDLELEENKYANKGDLLYLWATSFGPEIWNEETVIYHYHIWKLEFLTNELDKQYLYTWLLTDKEKIKQTTNGTTMVHVTKGIMEQRLFQFPKDVKEQQKIGTFFKQLDDTIALHQRELDLLRKTKQTYLQKMFPKTGEDRPEIRFTGFTEPWEQRKLGELTKTTIGEFVIRSKQNPAGDYPVYNGGKTYTGFYDEYNNESNKIVISARGANAGFINLVKTKYWAGNSCYSVDIINKKDINLDYLYQFMKNKQHFFTDYQQAANIPSVSKKDVETFSILLPSLSEQQKIGSFFKQLDDTIALHQHNLNALKEMKKSLLRQMFV
ncbi:restriction endonuclease subunit S [Enterococcus sp. AZ067]|uniref:restriction endonuclease subunit S n=1 Tax=Enterococcus sp. AZ067 TaxID=2774674 RepID=UPI003F69209D